MNGYKIIQGDALDCLKTMESESVQCVVTSPPYFGLRDYGIYGQIGLEKTPEEYISKIVGIFKEVKRVLRSDGTLWLNLGDSYASKGKENGDIDKDIGLDLNRGRGRLNNHPLIKSKDLIGIPWRVAFALQKDGWYLRSDIIWYKPNAMPESVIDRPTKSHEYIFLMTKSKKYYYDSKAIAEQSIWANKDKRADGNGKHLSEGKSKQGKYGIDGVSYGEKNEVGQFLKNKRSVWTIPTQSFLGEHFATFPEALVESCIKAGTKIGDTILDPFSGSGTTGLVSIKNQRKYVGIELNQEYVKMSEERIHNEVGLFAMMIK